MQRQAIPRDPSGNPLPEQPVTWSSSNTTIARVTNAGLVTAAATGIAFVVATSEGVSDTSLITATTVPVASVTLSPPTASIDVGQTVQLQAITRDADGATLTGRYIHSVDEIVDTVVNEAQPGDVVAVLSNGGFGGIHKKLLEWLG